MFPKGVLHSSSLGLLIYPTRRCPVGLREIGTINQYTVGVHLGLVKIQHSCIHGNQSSGVLQLL